MSVRTSKFLSLVLRHEPERIGIVLDASGWTDVEALLVVLAEQYAPRGVNLVRRGDKWAFRTAQDLNFLLRREQTDNRPLSRPALETLAIIAYHQPATRAEVEEVRGVATGKGTLDLLMEAGWVRMRGRRRTPGRPVTFAASKLLSLPPNTGQSFTAAHSMPGSFTSIA